MLVTFILRLLPDRLAKGELVGEVERVGDGEHAYVNGAEDLVAFARHSGVASARITVDPALTGSEAEDPAAGDSER